MADNSLKKGRYTTYGNKIGLFSNSKGSFISQSSDVVINFPFKDTILEGGMSKEEVSREELFLHYEMDRADVDTLEDPKVLTNFKAVDKNGERSINISEDNIFFDENDELTNSLLIKGNNLLTLYTLRERLTGKVKVIYIDPPYNTGNDGFKYNDKFKHSSWLVFMKNRLEVARQLLRDDGVIYISCDDNEQAYLRVLLDEIFEADNFVASLIWKKGAGTQNDNNYIAVAHEYVLVFAKDKQKASFYNLPPSEEMLRSYTLEDENATTSGKYKLRNLNDFSIGDRPGLHYDITCPDGTILIGKDHRWRCDNKKFDKRNENGRIVFKKNNNEWQVFYKQYINEKKEELIYDDNGNLLSYGRIPTTIIEDAGFTGDGKKDIQKIFGEAVFTYPKPVKLISQIIGMSAKNSDIVLDFFAGSGTTGQAVLGLNKEDGGHRKFILVEQIDYVNNVTLPRLEKYIQQNSSDESFYYFELKKYNQEYVDLINRCNSKGELNEVYNEMAKNAFLKFWFNKREFEKDESYRSLKLDEQKHKLIDILDENQLYLNYPDMRDSKHNVNDIEKELTDSFYGKTA